MSDYQILQRFVSSHLGQTVGRCTSCGAVGTKANPLTIDHIIPISKKGSSKRENLQILCRECNGLKADSKLKTSEKIYRLVYIFKQKEDLSDTSEEWDLLLDFLEFFIKNR